MSKTKIGRNDPCHCGSGKKFKKCCASRDITVSRKSNNNNLNSSEKILVMTLTDELFQPMRLYYIVHDKEKLKSLLKNLKCVEYDENLKDWVIYYADEAAKIKLKVPPSKVPKQARPLVIATIYIDNEHAMLIDIRSIERASKLIEFIDKYIPKAVVQITHAAIYNQLISSLKDAPKSAIDVDYDVIFSQKNTTTKDPEKYAKELKAFAAKNKKERIQALIKRNEGESKKQLPKVEKFPVHYYEEGIDSFNVTCRMRQVIATQHYLGNEDFSFYDLVHKMVHQTPEIQGNVNLEMV